MQVSIHLEVGEEKKEKKLQLKWCLEMSEFFRGGGLGKGEVAFN